MDFKFWATAFLPLAIIGWVMSFVWLNQAIAWRKKAYAFEKEANEAADLMVKALIRFEQHEKIIADITAQRDNAITRAKFMSSGYRSLYDTVTPAERILAEWNVQHPKNKFTSLGEFMAAAYAYDGQGRITRVVPPVPHG